MNTCRIRLLDKENVTGIANQKLTKVWAFAFLISKHIKCKSYENQDRPLFIKKFVEWERQYNLSNYIFQSHSEEHQIDLMYKK